MAIWLSAATTSYFCLTESSIFGCDMLLGSSKSRSAKLAKVSQVTSRGRRLSFASSLLAAFHSYLFSSHISSVVKKRRDLSPLSCNRLGGNILYNQPTCIRRVNSQATFTSWQLETEVW